MGNRVGLADRRVGLADRGVGFCHRRVGLWGGGARLDLGAVLVGHGALLL